MTTRAVRKRAAFKYIAPYETERHPNHEQCSPVLRFVTRGLPTQGGMPLRAFVLRPALSHCALHSHFSRPLCSKFLYTLLLLPTSFYCFDGNSSSSSYVRRSYVLNVSELNMEDGTLHIKLCDTSQAMINGYEEFEISAVVMCWLTTYP